MENNINPLHTFLDRRSKTKLKFYKDIIKFENSYKVETYYYNEGDLQKVVHTYIKSKKVGIVNDIVKGDELKNVPRKLKKYNSYLNIMKSKSYYNLTLEDFNEEGSVRMIN